MSEQKRYLWFRNRFDDCYIREIVRETESHFVFDTYPGNCLKSEWCRVYASLEAAQKDRTEWLELLHAHKEEANAMKNRQRSERDGLLAKFDAENND